MIKKTSTLTLALGAVLTLAVVAVPDARAQSEKKDVAAEKAPQATGGLVIAIDPATGKIRQPEPAEINALNSTAPAPGKKTPDAKVPQPFALPGGGVGLMLDRSFDCAGLAIKTAEGKMKFDCVVGEENASAVAQAKAAAKKTERLDEK